MNDITKQDDNKANSFRLVVIICSIITTPSIYCNIELII